MPPRKNDKVRDFLLTLPAGELADWVAATAKELPDLKRRLDLFAARNSDPADAVANYRTTMATLTKSRNRNPMKRAREAKENFENLLNSLQADFESGRLRVVLEVIPDALVALDRFFQEHTDPKGKVAELLPRFEKLHLDAATEARPGGAYLASQLARCNRECLLGAFLNGPYIYRDLLDDDGLAEFRQLVDPDLQAFLVKRDRGWMNLAKQLDSWARALEPAAVSMRQQAVLWGYFAADANGYLESARLWRRIGEPAEAVAVLTKGFNALRVLGVQEVAEQLIAELIDADQPEQAWEIAWSAFERLPGERSYAELLSVSARLNKTDEAKQRVHALMPRFTPDTALRLYLVEGNLAAARDVANQGGVSLRGWHALAEHYAGPSPVTAIGLFFWIADQRATLLYGPEQLEAASDVHRARALAQTPETREKFDAELGSFLAKHRRKVNLMSVLA